MQKYKLLTKIQKLFFNLPRFRGKEELVLLANRLLNDQKDHVIIDFDQDLLVNVNLSSHIERTVFWFRVYEENIARLMNAFIKEESVCLDVGANVGIHSIFMAKRAKKGHVYCFEPFPPMVERLNINIRLNRFSNVTLFPIGLGDVDEEKTLYTVDPENENQGQSSFLNLTYLSSSMRVQMRNPSGIQELNQLHRLDFIKIDVEGLEPIVIKALLPFIKKYGSTVLFEYNKEAWIGQISLDDILIWLREAGYIFYAVEKGNKRIRQSSELETEYCNILSVKI